MLKRTLSGLMLLALTSLPAAAQAPQARQFLQGLQYSTGANSTPQAFAIADFNNDGIPDVAVADSGTNSVSIYLGNGSGIFTPTNCSTGTLTCPVGTNPQGIAVDDFNQDGKEDLAVTNFASGTITILFGNGDGTFTVQANSPVTGRSPRGIAVADFNGDNYPDLVVTNSQDGTVGLFINNGNGGFGTQTIYNTGNRPWAVAVGDFNGDHVPDIVVANYNNNNELSVYLGTGSPTCKTGPNCFGGQLPAFTGTNPGSPVSVAVGDFNGDGNLDIAAAVQGDNDPDNVAVLLGKGNGGFQAAQTYTTASFPTGIAVADLNGDGNPDLAVAAADANVVTVFWGIGNGTFAGQVNCGTGDIPYAVGIANLNPNATNSQNDLIVANSQGNSFSVIMNNGNESFQSRLDYAAGPSPYAVAWADFNGDHIPDLVLADSTGASQISVLLGNGDGTFGPPNVFSTGTATDPVAVMVGDFNLDGIPDLAVANYATSTVSIFIGNGDGTFQTHADYAVGNPGLNFPDAEPSSIAIGDFNGDGYPDLAVTNFNEDSVSVLINNGDSSGTFQTAVNYGSTVGVGDGPISVAAAKLNGDKFLDLVVVNETSNSATILEGDGSGGFSEKSVINPLGGGNPLFVVVGDFNGDKVPDLAVADLTSQQVSIFLGAGSWQGTGFSSPQFYSVGAYPSALVTQDFNGDGKLDLAVTSTPVSGSPGDEVSLLWGNGDGTFQQPAFFGAGYFSYSLVSADFNGDGAFDLAVANGKSNTVSILLNLQGTKIDFAPLPAQLTFGQSVTLTATVAASVSNVTAPTGNVTFQNSGTVIGAQSLVNGAASVSTSSLPAGSNSLAAVYSGDSNYQAHTVYLSQTVSSASSTTSLSSSSNPSAPSQTATFNAFVVSSTTQPGGTVTFFDGSTSLGTGTLNGSGKAVFSTSTLSTGPHNITAVYAGNSNITGSTSSVLQQIIGVVTAANFSLTANWSTSNNIAPGSTATAQVTINPVGGLNPATVQLSCTVSPSATPSATCQLGSITVANGVGTATLTFKTAGATSALVMPSDNPGSNMLFAVGLMIPALLLGGAGLTKPGRKKFMSFCLCLALAGCVASMACGGGGKGSTTPLPSGNSGTPAGAYQVMVSGSASGIQNSLATPLSATVK
ncbi:MAG TPA: FG-GAP-like repeat-containing protein [Candidatus Sulfotelmatobacter sp.]|jgi:hypothetical protein